MNNNDSLGSTNPPADPISRWTPFAYQPERIETMSSQNLSDDFHTSLPELSDPSLFHQNSSHPADLCSPKDIGVKSISSGIDHHLLLTYSGEVYGWGWNVSGHVFYNGPKTIKSPIKLPLYDIITISAGYDHSLALSSDGKLYGWGRNGNNQINMSSSGSLPITLINIPYSVKKVYGGERCSFAISQEGQVVRWGDRKSFEVMNDLNNIDNLNVDGNSFLATDKENNMFYWRDHDNRCTMLEVNHHSIPFEPLENSIVFDSVSSLGWSSQYMFFIDFNGEIWKFNIGSDCIIGEPIKIEGLGDIIYICRYRGYANTYAAIDKNGQVYVWGELGSINGFCNKPHCIGGFSDVKGISIAKDFLFAYNERTIWGSGLKNSGQLGSAELIGQLQPVTGFGSEILSTFESSEQPLSRLFRHLIKLILFHYLYYLEEFVGNFSYLRARFYVKCGISKRVAQLAHQVFEAHPIPKKMFLKDPQDLNLNDNLCDLQLHLSTAFDGPKVINTTISKLEIYIDRIRFDAGLLTLFPNVVDIKLTGKAQWRPHRIIMNFTNLPNLQCLELDYGMIVHQLPASLVKLVLKNSNILIRCLNDLPSLKELVVLSHHISYPISMGQIPLTHSINRLEVVAWNKQKAFPLRIHLPKLKELIVHGIVPKYITEAKFPSLRFVHLVEPRERSLSKSPFFPTKLINQGLIKSVKLIRSEYLVELSCFPWWIQYSACLNPLFCHYIDQNKELAS
ncbi:hypothetical protein P9112_001786 [Eukaryota sp. TZLM1-RC]